MVSSLHSELSWARAQGYCKSGSGGQRKVDKIRATFWDSKNSQNLELSLNYSTTFRKILVSVKFVSVIPGPEMGCANFMDTWKMRSFCRKNRVRKIPRFWGFWGGGSADFIFMGARIFLKLSGTGDSQRESTNH